MFKIINLKKLYIRFNNIIKYYFFKFIILYILLKYYQLNIKKYFLIREYI